MSGLSTPWNEKCGFSKLSFALSSKACHAFVDEMTQGISRRAARSRRPKKLQDAFAQVPFCFARAARIVWRIAPRVGDESFWFFIVACWCALTKLSQGRLVEGKVGGDPINRKVGPELENYLKSWPLVRSQRKNTKVHTRTPVSILLANPIHTFFCRGWLAARC